MAKTQPNLYNLTVFYMEINTIWLHFLTIAKTFVIIHYIK